MVGNSNSVFDQPLLHQHDGDHKPPLEGARRFRRCRTAPSSEPPPADNVAAPFVPPKTLFKSGAWPSFRLVGLLLLAYLLLVSTAFYLTMDHMSGTRTNRALDALYFCVVTMTTVGYGDLVPASEAAKLLACAFVFTGVTVVGTFLSKAADYLVEKQEVLLFHALHSNAAAVRISSSTGAETAARPGCCAPWRRTRRRCVGGAKLLRGRAADLRRCARGVLRRRRWLGETLAK